MNDVAINPAAMTGAATEVAILFSPETALAVLTDAAQFDAFYARVRAETLGRLVPDISTLKGRDEIRAMAMKVVRTKTGIIKAKKDLTEEWRANTTKANTAGNAIEVKLDALRDEVRAPLTVWEEAEAAREVEIKAVLARLQGAAVVTQDDTLDTVRARLSEIEAVVIDGARFGDWAAAAQAHQERTTEHLTLAVARLTKEAADAVELARLRSEAEARRRADQELAAETQRATEAADAERSAAAQREAFIVETARQDQVRADQAKAAIESAAAQARADEARKAAEAQAVQDRAHQDELTAQRQATEQAQAEARRVQEVESARVAEAAEQQRLADLRAADREHRAKVKSDAVTAIVALAGIKEGVAEKIVLAVIAGEIPAMTLVF